MNSGSDPVQSPVLSWLSERCLRVEFPLQSLRPPLESVLEADRLFRLASIPGVTNITSAFRTVVVELDPRVDANEVAASVSEVVRSIRPTALNNGRLHEIPVCYDGSCAPDLAQVAAHCGLAPAEVLRRHQDAEYCVAFIGFTPGFPYLIGLPKELQTPRLDRPRLRVPAGSVGIAGAQTGIYPRSTPGGWKLIGRTPIRLFDATRERPSLLEPGDRVRFVSIPLEAFESAIAEAGGR